jgi:hypothetical protein
MKEATTPINLVSWGVPFGQLVRPLLAMAALKYHPSIEL